VIDDDRLALESLAGLLGSWGHNVVPAASDCAALAELPSFGKTPDLIIADYRLAGGKTGIEAIEALRRALGEAVPAFLISGDTAPDRLRQARALGFHLVHKPVSPMALRSTLAAFSKRQKL
jgi:CheY-like chemotaxis protein